MLEDLYIKVQLRVAEALLFAKNLERFFLSCRIRFIRYDRLEGKVGTEVNLINLNSSGV